MATVLIAVIYAAFIGLGLPDSLFGTAWPSIYTEFDLPIALGGLMSAVGFIGTVTSSMLSVRLIKKMGTARLTALCTLLTGVSLLGFGFANKPIFIFLLAIPLGLGAGSIDTGLNNYVALHYSASKMSFLHCFYGVGVTVSPFILALVFRNGSSWRVGYRIAAGIQLFLALIISLSIPIWTKVNGQENSEEKEYETLSFRQAVKIPGVPVMWLLFFLSCAIESSVGSWCSTFLVEARHLTNKLSAQTVTFYYLGMTLGRFFSGVLAKKLHSWQIVKLGFIVLAVAVTGLLIFDNGTITIISLMLIGVGNGPMFPNFNYLTPENFDEKKSPAIIGTQMVASNCSFIAMPFICGMLGQYIGMWVFPYFVLSCYALFLLVFIRAGRIWKMPKIIGNRARSKE